MNSKPAFVIGVSGKMKFPGYQDNVTDPEKLCPISRSIRDRVFGVLDWARSESGGRLDLVSGKFDPHGGSDSDPSWWKPLGLQETPIVVLSSLAPGVDTLVAEAAMDYAVKKGAQVLVRAPLPFPLDVFPEATTFCPEKDGETAETWRAKQDRFANVVGRVRGQKNVGFIEQRDIFEVELHPDLVGDAREDLGKELPGGQFRRRLRYRAAGDFVATKSDLLLTAFDMDSEPEGKPEDPYNSRTTTIVETKREGLTYGILPGDNSFSWADNGPVLHLPIPSQEGVENDQPMAMLHPYDSKPPGKVVESKGRNLLRHMCLAYVSKKTETEEVSELEDDDPDWQESGAGFFRRILNLQEVFNAEEENPGESDELEALLKPARDSEIAPQFEPTDRTAQYCATLDATARVRCRAKLIAHRIDAQRAQLMAQLVWLIFAAATALGAYEHWDDQASPEGTIPVIVCNPEGIVQTILLGLTLGFLLLSAFVFRKYLKGNDERKRFDYRALAEGLRVQIAWSVAGVAHSVDSHYMQRQRSEMDWIRCAISSLNSPSEYRRRLWDQFQRAERATLLETVRLSWVREQCAYTKETKQKNQGRGSRWHHLGWALAAAGLINVIAKFLCELLPRLNEWLEHHARAIALAGFLIGLAISLVSAILAQRKGDSPHHAKPDPKGGFLRWLMARPQLWGWGLMAGSAIFVLPHLISGLHGSLAGYPETHGAWIILTGMVLLASALCLAWNERNLHNETARQNQALEHLFQCADRRLEKLILAYKSAPTDSPQTERSLREIHSILFQLGCEALDENT
ncbi:MAG: hypothetical protein GY930_02990, partial [bacterium]|nr:hypothetical protein [bacterium]